MAAFEHTTAALGRSTASVRQSAPLANELKSSLVLLFAVLGLPLLLVLLLAT